MFSQAVIFSGSSSIRTRMPACVLAIRKFHVIFVIMKKKGERNIGHYSRSLYHAVLVFICTQIILQLKIYGAVVRVGWFGSIL